MPLESSSLKRLTRRLEGIDAELAATEAAARDLDARLRGLHAARSRLQGHMDKATAERAAQGQVAVSEHALLRYFERVLGYDLEQVRRDLLPETLERQVAVLGAGLFPVPGKDYSLRVKNGVVVTVLLKSAPAGAVG